VLGVVSLLLHQEDGGNQINLLHNPLRTLLSVNHDDDLLG